MTCPYCGRRTGDMVTHLEKYKNCHEEHCGSLVRDLRYIYNKHVEKQKEIKQEQKDER
jgi:hypothetical protein